MKIERSDTAQPADTSTELRIKYAFMRRALAYDQCGLVSYDILAAWTELLYSAMMRAPPDHYKAISMDQILAADKALFIVAARMTRSGISPKPDGTKPLEDAIIEAQKDCQVTTLLMNLPHGGHGGHNVSSNSGNNNVKVKKWGQKGNAGKGAKTNGSSKGSGGKSKGKGRGKGPNMPQRLMGMHYMTPDGSPICFNFNLDGCSGAALGGTCGKGKHVCCTPRCYGDHSLSNCTKTK